MNIIRPLIFLLLCFRGFGCLVIAADLPANDANKYQIIVVGDRTVTPGVAEWFNQSPDLAKLKAATAFTSLTPKANEQARDGLFETRYRSVLGSEFPIVAYLRPDGGVIYFADRHSMPSRDKLYEEIKDAHWMAKKAVPVKPNLTELADQDWIPMSEGIEDCVDGSCDTTPDNATTPRFPKLRPLKNPFDSTDPSLRPAYQVFSGLFKNSISSGIFLVFSVVCLMVIVLFAVLIFGAMIVVVRWVVK